MEGMKEQGWSNSNFMKFLKAPIPGVTRIVPIFGGRSLFELIAGILIIILTFSLGFSDPLLAGNAANFSGFLLIFFLLRKNFLLTAFAITFETSVFWHKFFAVLIVFLVLIHAIGEKFNNASGLAMFTLIIITCLLYLFTFWGKFNYFYFPHVIIFVILIPLLFVHGAVFFGIAGLLWLIDRYLRYFHLRKDIKNAEILQVSESVFRISFPKAFDYNVAQYCFLRVRKISEFDYHPFSISSCPSDPQTSFHIKRVGHWTKQLSELGPTCDIDIEGPYGHLSIDLLNSKTYPVIILVAGGIGLTPILSVFKYIRSNPESLTFSKVVLIWSEKDVKEATAIYKDQFEHYIQPDHAIESGKTLFQEKVGNTIFEYRFHITSTNKEKLTELQKSNELPNPKIWKYGRCKIPSVLHKLQMEFSSCRLGLFVCGPFPLVVDIRDYCDSFKSVFSTSSYQNLAIIDVHEESFSMSSTSAASSSASSSSSTSRRAPFQKEKYVPLVEEGEDTIPR